MTTITQNEQNTISIQTANGSKYYLRKMNNLVAVAGWIDTWWCGQLIGEINTNDFFNEIEENHSVTDAVYGIYRSKMPELYDAISTFGVLPLANEMYKSCMFCCCRHGDVNIGPDGTDYPKFFTYDKTEVSEVWTLEKVFKRLENIVQKLESPIVKISVPSRKTYVFQRMGHYVVLAVWHENMGWWTGYVIDFDENIDDNQLENHIHCGITGCIILNDVENSEIYQEVQRMARDVNDKEYESFKGYGFDCAHFGDYCNGPNGEEGNIAFLADSKKLWTESSVIQELKNAIKLAEDN